MPFGSLASALDKTKERKPVEEEVVKNLEFGFSWSQLSGDRHELACPLRECARVPECAGTCVCPPAQSLVFNGCEMEMEPGQKACCGREHIQGLGKKSQPVLD